MAKHILKGIPVSAGVSVGKAFFMNRRHFDLIPRHIVPPDAVARQEERLAEAFEAAQTGLADALTRVPEALKEHAAIIRTHLAISQDPKLLKAAVTNARDMGITAEWALEKAVAEIERAFNAIEDAYIRERIEDVRLVAGRVQQILLGQKGPGDLSEIKNRVVLMAHDLTPADTVGLEPEKIMSFATAEGGKTSHTGILARTMQIPALVGVEGLEEFVSDGDLVILDGLKGRILVDPDERELTYYSDLKYQFEAYQQTIIRRCTLPGETIDGYRLNVLANIELTEEIDAVTRNGGEGVGLYRTEYSFLNRTDLPSEEELYQEYAAVAQAMGSRRVTFRTLDIGADKFMRHFGSLDEMNPALGLRAIRFCLKHPSLFRSQLRAILRAAKGTNAALMFPMISGLKEIMAAKSILRSVKAELTAEGVPHATDLPVGIMVELPSAVMIASILAEEVDFFSIGTNDLIQYSLGIDRTNKHVSYLYQPLHPSILRSLKLVVDAAHQAGIEVSVCGELASDPYCVPILMGLQVDSLSITPQAIPGVKRIIRQTTMEECKDLLREILTSKTVGTINRQVTESIYRRFPEELTFFSSLLDSDDV